MYLVRVIFAYPDYCVSLLLYSRTSGSGHPINQGTLLIRPVAPRPFLVNFNVNNLIKMATSLIRPLLDSPKGGLINEVLLYMPYLTATVAENDREIILSLPGSTHNSVTGGRMRSLLLLFMFQPL